MLGIVAYCLIVSGRMSPAGRAYPIINLVAVVLSLLSLTEQFNLNALIINAFYGVVSIYGLWKHAQRTTIPADLPH